MRGRAWGPDTGGARVGYCRHFWLVDWASRALPAPRNVLTKNTKDHQAHQERILILTKITKGAKNGMRFGNPANLDSVLRALRDLREKNNSVLGELGGPWCSW